MDLKSANHSRSHDDCEPRARIRRLGNDRVEGSTGDGGERPHWESWHNVAVDGGPDTPELQLHFLPGQDRGDSSSSSTQSLHLKANDDLAQNPKPQTHRSKGFAPLVARKTVRSSY